MIISALGLGTWAVAGTGWEFAWGSQHDGEAVATIHHAVDSGINWIDTAAVYGLGHAEEIVGQALSELPGSRRPYVFTKCSLVWDEHGNISHSLAPTSLREEIEASLRRLRTERIDLYQVHWPAFPPGAPVGGIEKAMYVLDDLRREGKLREIGVSNFNVSQLLCVRAVTRVVSLQPPYSLLMRGIEEELLPFCEEEQIGVIVYSPLQSGLLSGAMTRERIAALPEDDRRKTRSVDFQEPRLTQNLALVEVLRAVGAKYGKSPAEIAIAWALRRPAVTGAIVGARRPAQLDGLVGAAELMLDDADLHEIENHIPEGVGVNVPTRQ